MKKEIILKLLKELPYKIGHLVGFYDLTILHNEWIKNLYTAQMIIHCKHIEEVTNISFNRCLGNFNGSKAE